jgi:hypothetical protein
MDYDRIILEMLNRIKILEDRVAVLENGLGEGIGNNAIETDATPASSKKYRLLSDYLHNSEDDKVRLTFGDIERIIGFKPPPSAYIHRAFWANTKTHSIALSWMSVGFETVEVNIGDRYVIFERKRDYGKMMATGRKKVDELLVKIGNDKINGLQSAELEEGEF